MEKSGRLIVAAAAALLVALVVGSLEVGEASISCGTVSSKISPCVGYLTGSTTSPSGDCCPGVQSLYALTKADRADRVTTCNCFKSLASALGSKLKSSSVSALPSECAVNLGYGISVSTDCASIP